MTPRPGFDPASLVAGADPDRARRAAAARPGRRARPAASPTCCRRVLAARRRDPAGLRPRRPAARALLSAWEHPPRCPLPETTRPAPLRRDPAGAVLGGVCAGLAPRLGVDPLVLRIGFVASSRWPAASASRSTRSAGRASPPAPASGARGRSLAGLVRRARELAGGGRDRAAHARRPAAVPRVGHLGRRRARLAARAAAGGGALIWRQSQGATVVEPPPRERALPGGGAGRAAARAPARAPVAGLRRARRRARRRRRARLPLAQRRARARPRRHARRVRRDRGADA